MREKWSKVWSKSTSYVAAVVVLGIDPGDGLAVDLDVVEEEQVRGRHLPVYGGVGAEVGATVRHQAASARSAAHGAAGVQRTRSNSPGAPRARRWTVRTASHLHGAQKTDARVSVATVALCR